MIANFETKKLESWDITLQWDKGEGIRIREISDRPSLETRHPPKKQTKPKKSWKK